MSSSRLILSYVWDIEDGLLGNRTRSVVTKSIGDSLVVSEIGLRQRHDASFSRRNLAGHPARFIAVCEKENPRNLFGKADEKYAKTSGGCCKPACTKRQNRRENTGYEGVQKAGIKHGSRPYFPILVRFPFNFSILLVSGQIGSRRFLFINVCV